MPEVGRLKELAYWAISRGIIMNDDTTVQSV